MKKSKNLLFLVFLSGEVMFFLKKHFHTCKKKTLFLQKEQKTPRVSLLAEENPQTEKNSKKWPTRETRVGHFFAPTYEGGFGGPKSHFFSPLFLACFFVWVFVPEKKYFLFFHHFLLHKKYFILLKRCFMKKKSYEKVKKRFLW